MMMISILTPFNFVPDCIDEIRLFVLRELTFLILALYKWLFRWKWLLSYDQRAVENSRFNEALAYSSGVLRAVNGTRFVSFWCAIIAWAPCEIHTTRHACQSKRRKNTRWPENKHTPINQSSFKTTNKTWFLESNLHVKEAPLSYTLSRY